MKKLSAIKLRSQLREIKPFLLLLPTILSFVQEQLCSLSTFVTTVLIQKSKAKSLIPSNYRPITCLCTAWKILTGTVADAVHTHLESQNATPVEKKRCRKNTHGTKDQLLIDKLLSLDSKTYELGTCVDRLQEGL